MKRFFAATVLLTVSMHGNAATYDATASFEAIQLLTTLGSPTSSYAGWTFGYADFSEYSFAPYSFFNGHRTSENGYISNFTWALSATTSAGYPPMAWIYEGDRSFQGIQSGTLVLQPSRPTLSYNSGQGELEILDQRSSVIRFTAPSTATYSIAATASSAEASQRFLVATGNIATPLLDQFITSSGISIALNVFLQSGQTIDFIGVSTLATGDNTYIPVSITISNVPEPSSLWAAISGFAVIGASVRMRRSSSQPCLRAPA
jgi:hypothetical protein